MGKTFRVWSGSRRGGQDCYKKKLRRERRQNLKESIRNSDENIVGNVIANRHTDYDLNRKGVSQSLRDKIRSLEKTEGLTLPNNHRAKVYVADSGRHLVVSTIDPTCYDYHTIYNQIKC